MKNYIVSIVLATAAIFAVGLAAYSANGNYETTIHGGKLMAETSVITEEKDIEPEWITTRNFIEWKEMVRKIGTTDHVRMEMFDCTYDNVNILTEIEMKYY